MVDIKLASLSGDGIGSEVVKAALLVLESAGEQWGARFVVEPIDAGAARYARSGAAYAESDFELCRAADVILLGALGLPEVVHSDGTEVGPDLQFRLRFDLDLYAGVRPVRRYFASPGPLATPDPFAFTIIRENTEGLYASRGGGAAVGDKVATDTLIVTAPGQTASSASPSTTRSPIRRCRALPPSPVSTRRMCSAATHFSGLGSIRLRYSSAGA